LRISTHNYYQNILSRFAHSHVFKENIVKISDLQYNRLKELDIFYKICYHIKVVLWHEAKGRKYMLSVALKDGENSTLTKQVQMFGQQDVEEQIDESIEVYMSDVISSAIKKHSPSLNLIS